MLERALIWVPTAVVVAILMDVWAGFLHGVLWHGPWWGVHRSHHEPRTGRFEKNDAFAFLHAPPAIALILIGCLAAPGVARELAYGVGVGMTAFALGYALVHEGLVHGRLPVAALGRIGFLRRVAKAHRIHHSLPGGRPYSLFFGIVELRIAQRLRRAPGAPRRPSAPSARGRALS